MMTQFFTTLKSGLRTLIFIISISVLGMITLSVRGCMKKDSIIKQLNTDKAILQTELNNKQEADKLNKVYVDKTNIVINDLHTKNVKIKEEFKGSNINCIVPDFQKIFNEVILK